jgi:hypothetical protein
MSSTRRLITLFVALAAAACFALSVQGGRWWTVGEHSIGPVTTTQCWERGCETGGLQWTEGSDAWQRAGYATWAAGMVAMVVMLALAGALAAKQRGMRAAQIAVVATMTAIVAGALFQQLRPTGQMVTGIALGRGSFLFAVAIVAALGAAIATLRAPQPAPSTPPG